MTDINKFREDRESRAGRPPAGPARSLDIRKRDAAGSPGADEAPQQVTLPSSPLTQPRLAPDTADTARADISDLVNIDAMGRGHEPSQTNVSGSKSGGQLISEDNMDVIAANADYIRDNLPGSDTTPDTATPDTATPDTATPDTATPDTATPDTAATEDISDLVNISKDNLDTIAANADYIRNNLPGSDTTPGVTTPEGPYPPFDLYPPDDEDEPETPPGETPPGETPPEEPAPGGPDGPESRRDGIIRNLDDAIVAFAAARVALEKVLGGKNQEAYDTAEANLHRAYNEYIANLSEEVAEGNRELRDRIEHLDDDIDAISDQISDTEDAIASAAPDADIAQMYANMAAHEARQQVLEGRQDELQSQIEANEARHNEIIAQRVTEVSARVDNEMLAQRERAHPRLTKINEWLRTHTKTRIIVGVALAASGFVGVVTGNVPLVVGSIAARAALSGYGGYNAARGFGERRADKRYNAADTSSIEDYTAAAGDQSRTRRRSKKTGAVIGGALAAVPIIRGIANAGDVVPAPKSAPVPETPIPTPPNIPNLTPTDFRFPWQHMTDQIGSNGTPRIMEIANNAPNLGWQVIGNGQGGGNGAILRIIDPGGNVYAGNGPINAALDYLGTQTP